MAGLCIAFSCFFHRNVSVRVMGTGYATVTVVETADFTVAVMSGENTYAYTTAKRHLTACGADTVDVLVVTDCGKQTDALLDDLLNTVSVETVLCAEKNALTNALPLKDGQAFANGDMLSLTTIDGWWRMDIGGTRVLFTADDVADLPADWQRSHLMVVRQAAPKNIELLTAQRVVAICTARETDDLTAALKDMPCPVTVNENVCLFTKGQGDLTTGNHFWL
jgi:hypothetical protein